MGCRTTKSNHAATWQAYQPSDESPWNLARVWTLHRRACFGGTWEELQRDLADGPTKSVERVLNGDTRLQGLAPEFEATSDVLRESAINSNRIERLRAWWVYRMYFGPHPLLERMTITWHNHFATSNRTIQNLRMMLNQNQLFRKHGLGPFPQLLKLVVKDPTMLIWLNADDNRESEPNENLGRELLELFSTGVGHYTEDDVKEAARALTGWTVMNGQFHYRHYWHDEYDKTVLGKTGNWSGDDVLQIVCDHPATASRMAWRLCDDLLGENVASQTAIDELADGIRKNQMGVSWALRTILSSELFYSDANIRRRIADPETFVIGNVRMLEYFQPPASTLALAGWLQQLGRGLFDPPNVGGWDGGRLWLNARTIVARSNFANSLTRGKLNSRNHAPQFSTLVEKYAPSRDLEGAVQLFGQLLLGLNLDEQPVAELVQKTTESVRNQSLSKQQEYTAVVEMLLNSSLAQLC